MTIAKRVQPLVESLLGEPPISINFWDGSRLGPLDSTPSLEVNSPNAVKHMLWAPGDLGVARAYVSGEIDSTGDVVDVMLALSQGDATWAGLAKALPSVVSSAKAIGLVGGPPAVPQIEYQPPLLGAHSRKGDANAISHHYDVSNEFYKLVLGEAMTYSCAFFETPETSLVDAQAAKHDNICRKLGLHTSSGQRLLDVGCGWGSMAIHAAKNFEADVTAITISKEQAMLAQSRVTQAGVSDLVEIKLLDYRDLGSQEFDAISSIGMSEHVGKNNLVEYFTILKSALRPEGRLLNHAISMVGGAKLSSRSFMYRYIFPGGELIDISDSLDAMQHAGFEIRDVESRREHYAMTLRHWITNLESNWDEAVELVGLERARAWKLYMAASAVGFLDAGLGLHQALAVADTASGSSGMPLVRPV